MFKQKAILLTGPIISFPIDPLIFHSFYAHSITVHSYNTQLPVYHGLMRTGLLCGHHNQEIGFWPSSNSVLILNTRTAMMTDGIIFYAIAMIKSLTSPFLHYSLVFLSHKNVSLWH